MDDVYRYIDENAPRFLDELKVLLRIPSIATDLEAVARVSSALKDHLDRVGMPSELMESTGNPMVVGQKPGAEGAPRVLLYGHYDVMPAGKRELWESEPFEPTERDGRIYCRGVGDNKAQHFAHIKALEALQACGVETPPLKIVLEGEEETGSESLPGFVKDHRELLAAELCYAADGPRHESNRPTVYLGCRGVLGLELYVEGIGRDVHSGNRGNIVPNPAWKLVHVLASMRDAKGRVTIEGFEDDVIPATNAERALLSELPYDGPRMAADLGVPELAGLAPADYYERLMFKPTLTINGLVGGYQGEGGMTVIPGRCSVKMDIRMVVNQDPERMVALVRRHLDKQGFGDVKIEVHDAMKPSRTNLENRYADTIVGAVREASGEEPVVWPSLGGSIPQYAFVEGLGTPCIWSAYANWDEANHAPNENVHIHLFIQAVKMSANVFNRLRETRA
jgi:acetylornithine deacetylase/succinyl-diaminopimelate desuccinylase-like protein